MTVNELRKILDCYPSETIVMLRDALGAPCDVVVITHTCIDDGQDSEVVVLETE